MNLLRYNRVIERRNAKCSSAQDNRSIDTSIAIYMQKKQF